MTKLNSEEIKKVVAEQAQIFNNERHYYKPESVNKSLNVPKLWKRVSKNTVLAHVSLSCIAMGQDPNKFSANYEFFKDYSAYSYAKNKGETILGDTMLCKNKCTVRRFAYKYAKNSLGCFVLTDEKDEQIIALLWHSD